MNYIGLSAYLHADFGSGTWDGQSIGIPYQIESIKQPGVTVNVTSYPGESDPGPIPIPGNALIQGYPQPGSGDRHVLILDNGNCWLYELYNSSRTAGKWSAAEVAIWDLTSNEQRPYTWTAADAAGLPIFPGLARYDEVAAGAIHHALGVTVPTTQQAFTPPASHWASSVTDSNAPPMGLRLRLKSSFDISGFPPDDQVLLTAMQQYGLIVTDNGAPLFVSGMPDQSWNNNDLALLQNITATDFEVVQTDGIYTPSNVPTGPAPVINSFSTSAQTVTRGASVTLSWTSTGTSYTIITPQPGPVRGSSIVVTPSATTTYTLNATNAYGRTTATVTVNVN